MAIACRTSDGHLHHTVEVVLDANQGLADEPQPCRTGVLIMLSDLPATVVEQVTLWD